MDPNMNVGSSQDFRLTWVNYSQKLTESFHKFLTSEILCNVTLWVHENGGGNSIKAHQAILSACSPWFEKILSQNQHPHPIIILKDVRYHDLKNIIRYVVKFYSNKNSQINEHCKRYNAYNTLLGVGWTILCEHFHGAVHWCKR